MSCLFCEKHDYILENDYGYAIYDDYQEKFKHLYEQAFDEGRNLLLEIYNGILATKSQEWSYEQEKRLIYILSFSQEDKLAKKYKTGINISLPESVILGEKTSEHDKKLIVSAIKKHSKHIKLKRATITQGEYLLSIRDEVFS